MERVGVRELRQNLSVYLREDADQVASAIVEVEVVRAVRRAAPDLTALAQNVVSQIALVEPTEAIRERAALLEPATLRLLDGLHLATALEIGDDLDGLVTYDGACPPPPRRWVCECSLLPSAF
jgi:predicted nucleic acid-binding protein